MKTSFLGLLLEAFPNALFKTPIGTEVFDINKELIGYFNEEIFILREEYTHYKQAKRALEQNEINHKTQSVKEALYGENN